MRSKKPDVPSEEYRRFREITKCLLAVPKKEIEREKAKYEKRKLQAKRPVK